ncbi:DUF4142 domain-containing protein [Pedobacter immunditicola]|uniref:DUF4142 domain-containing protein n=1 Tax=Pedobacter immunditicola TaxID=3133440 RepID=UPI0030A55679
MKSPSIFLFLAIFLAACVFWTCQNTDKTANSGDAPIQRMDRSTDLDTSDFMYKAAVAGKMEVELGQIAVQLTKNPQVKDFAAMMVKDHTQLNMELESLAYDKKLILPTVYPKRFKRRLSDMKKLNGRAFEKRYMSMMVQDQLKFHELFKTATKNKDPEISNLATKTLPVLEKHRQKANAVHASLQKD